MSQVTQSLKSHASEKVTFNDITKKSGILRLLYGYFIIFYVQKHGILNFVYFWDIHEHGSLEGFFYISLVRTTTPYEEEYS